MKKKKKTKKKKKKKKKKKWFSPLTTKKQRQVRQGRQEKDLWTDQGWQENTTWHTSMKRLGRTSEDRTLRNDPENHSLKTHKSQSR